MKFEIIKKSGTWFSYGEERIGQGRENAKKYLADNPATAQEIEAKIKVAAGLTPALKESEKTAEDPKAAEA